MHSSACLTRVCRLTDRLFGKLKNLMPGQIAGEALGILERSIGINLKLRADPGGDDLIERRAAVSSLPQNGRSAVQGEKRGVAARHDHHFAVETARGYPGISRHKELAHPINSQTRESGTKVRRDTGTRLTNSNAA